MIRYEELIATISEIINNENIKKEGLHLVYELPEKDHKMMDEHLFYKTNDRNTKFEHRDVIEVELGGLIVKIIKKDLEN